MTLFNPIPQPPGLPPLPLTARTPKANRPLALGGSSPSSDEYNQLLEFQWRGSGYPCTTFEEQGSHSLAVHKYPNLASARVENTGFDPRQWSAVLPMTNHIEPSTNETWSAGTLFTQAFLQLQADLIDTTSGILQHPILGQVIAKVRGWSWRASGDKPRDGVIITIHFIECLDDNFPIAQTNNNAVIIQGVLSTANALDVALGTNTDPTIMPPGLSLTGKFTQLAAYIRQVLAAPNQITTSINAQGVAVANTAGGIISNVIGAPSAAYQTAVGAFQLNKNVVLGTLSQIQSNSNNLISTTAAFNTVSGVNVGFPTESTINYNAGTLARVNASYQHTFNTYNTGIAQTLTKSIAFTNDCYLYFQSLNSNQTALIQSQLLNFLNTLYMAQQQLLANSNTTQYIILSLVTQVPMTFMQLAQYTNNTIDQIMQLNPDVSSLIFVGAQTQISYYSATGS